MCFVVFLRVFKRKRQPNPRVAPSTKAIAPRENRRRPLGTWSLSVVRSPGVDPSDGLDGSFSLVRTNLLFSGLELFIFTHRCGCESKTQRSPAAVFWGCTVSMQSRAAVPIAFPPLQALMERGLASFAERGTFDVKSVHEHQRLRFC